MHLPGTIRRGRFGPWLIPLLYAIAAIMVAVVLPRIEHHFFPHMVAELSVGSAIAIYSSIASGTMALTGIVLSLTFVMVQFSATAYSPRLVMWVARDPVLSHAIGVFSATFLYAVAALAWLDRNNTQKVPFLSALLVMALLLASVGMFVSLIHRISQLQINRMLVFTGNQGRKVITNLYEQLNSSPNNAHLSGYKRAPVQTLFHHGRPLSLGSINVGKLMQFAEVHDGYIELVVAVGDTVLEGTPLLHIFGVSCPIHENELCDALRLGEERTFEQDPKYAIRLLVDIAIRALSAAINDPTTAVQALDQIGDLLLRLGQKQLEMGPFQDSSGCKRLSLPLPSWNDFLHLAFEEILSYGARSVQVMRRMKALIADLLMILPPQRHTGLKYWQERLQASIARSFQDTEEKVSASAEDRQGLGIARYPIGA